MFNFIKHTLITLLLIGFLFGDLYSQNFIESGATLGINASAGDGFRGGGVSMVDYNQDGLIDITFGTESGSEILAYKNLGASGFELDTFTIPDQSHQRQIIWVDLDNDGDLDLFLANYNSVNRLYENDGSLNFTDITAASHIVMEMDDTYGTVFGDVDHDGYVDMYISNYFGYPSRLYKNDGDNTFTDMTLDAGLHLDQRLNFCSAFFDYDRDGDLDLYKINDKGYYNELYRNEGDFLFSEVSSSLNANLLVDAMGAVVGDMNNDGRLDIYVTNSHRDPNPGNVLLKNNYPSTFDNIQNTSGTGYSSWCWGGSWADFDNDGWQDLYVSSSGTISTGLRNQLYMNQGNETFIESGAALMAGDNEVSYACTVGDVDQNGQMDIIVVNGDNLNLRVWKNQINSTNNYTVITLEGTQSNAAGIGSWIDVHAGGRSYSRFTHCGIGFLSQESFQNHIGIGSSTLIDSITIRWPSGIIDQIEAQPANQTLHFIEGQNQIDFISPGGTIVDPVIDTSYSVARNWMELLLESIRNDYARPTVHARNLHHSSFMMYDCWAVYQSTSDLYFLGETIGNYTCQFSGIPSTADIETAREEAISYAMYRLLKHRFFLSPAKGVMFQQYDHYMDVLGLDPAVTSTNYTSGSPAALGNYIASQVIQFGLTDGSHEVDDYANTIYSPINDSLVMDMPGNPNLTDFNHWQPLTLELFIDQSGNQIDATTPEFLSPEWGDVIPFSLTTDDYDVRMNSSGTYKVFCDPGAPPLHDVSTNSFDYKWGFSLVSIWSSHLDAADVTKLDISPANIGNITSYPTVYGDYSSFYNLYEGGDTSPGHNVNPVTNAPYESQVVKRGDYARVLAEFWADGPDSETPPGHWFTLLHYVVDHPLHTKQYRGSGPVLDDLQWDVKAYFSLGGAMHDAAVAAWSLKGWYDYIRPVSAIRGMAELGQSSDPSLSNYHVGGLPLHPGYIELVQSGDPLAGTQQEHIGKVKLKAWKGPVYISNPAADEAGVSWILAENWWPYQRPSFVTPPFAGFVSGHSTYSRAAAEVLTLLTNDPFFPGGMGQFTAHKNEFLVFENGPSEDIILQWATYRDASDQCSLSRIWGGIHPPADDIPGRLIGKKIGIQAFKLAEKYIKGSICDDSFLQEDNDPIPLNYYGYSTIHSTGKVINPDVTFESYNHILLEPSFEVSLGAQFVTYLVGCP